MRRIASVFITSKENTHTHSLRYPHFYTGAAHTHMHCQQICTHIHKWSHTHHTMCYMVQTHGKDQFQLYSHCPIPGTAVFFGLNHMFTVLVGGSLGRVAHLPTRTIQGSLVHGRLTQRACKDSKAQPEVERSWKSAGLRMSRGHEYTVFSNIYRDSDCGCLSEESKPHLLHPLPAKWLKPSLSGCFKQA